MDVLGKDLVIEDFKLSDYGMILTSVTIIPKAPIYLNGQGRQDLLQNNKIYQGERKD